MQYDPDAGSHPDDDIDQVPLSFFMEQQRENDAIWEYYMSQLTVATKMALYDSVNDLWYIYAFCPFGTFMAGNITNATGAISSEGPYKGLLPNGAIQPDWRQLHPEIIVVPGEFAGVAAANTYVEAASKHYYTEAGIRKYAFIDLNFAGYPNDPYKFFQYYSGVIRQAWIDAGKPDTKKSMAKLFNAQKYLDDLAAEEAALEDKSAWSESMWPELPGFNTQYIDNIGIFAPVEFMVDPITTWFIAAEYSASGRVRDLIKRAVVIRRGTPYSSLGDQQNQALLQGASMIPYVGEVSRRALEALRLANQIPGQFWPRIYAFGRKNEMRVIQPNELRELATEYGKWYKGVAIDIGPADEGRIASLVQVLVRKGYISSYQAGEWLNIPATQYPLTNYGGGGGGLDEEPTDDDPTGDYTRW